MRDISIMSVPNGGFLIADFREGKSIAALSNSGDLIRWMANELGIADVLAPHTQPPSEFFERKDTDNTDGYAKIIRKSPEPEQDGFITFPREWREWDPNKKFVLDGNDRVYDVDLVTEAGHSSKYSYNSINGILGVKAYRLVKP